MCLVMEGRYLGVLVLGLCCTLPVVSGTDCRPGYYKSGDQCYQYSANCRNRHCDSNTGWCDDCAPGYYKSGDRCYQCSVNCKDGQCDSNTGICYGCHPGYHGDQCMSLCSTLSSRCTQCSQNGTCTACTGLFMTPSCTGCTPGYYKSGDHCYPCSVNCKDRQCDSITGSCYGCTPGYYKSGDHCYPCSVNCKDRQCDSINGSCYGCTPGYYKSGDSCYQCSVNCKDGQCDSITGRCNEVHQQDVVVPCQWYSAHKQEQTTCGKFERRLQMHAILPKHSVLLIYHLRTTQCHSL